MKPKQILILGVILGILAFGILLKSWVRSAGDHAEAGRGGSVAIAEFDPAKLERILISRPVKKDGRPAPGVELAKENGVWKVKSLWSANADPAKVENLIQKIHSAQGELRVSGKNLFSDFGIQDGEAFSIQLLGAGDMPLQDLRIGTKQAGETAFFVRKAGSENVYLVDVNMAELLGIYGTSNGELPQSLFWADLSLFNLDPEKVTKIAVYLSKGEEKTMVTGLERVTDPKDSLKSSWKFLNPERPSLPDPDKVLKYIVVMNSLRAKNVVDPGGKGYGLEQPVWQLAVTEAGKEKIFSAGTKDEKAGLVYGKRPGDPVVIALALSFFADLNVDDKHFEKEVPPVAVPKKAL